MFKVGDRVWITRDFGLTDKRSRVVRAKARIVRLGNFKTWSVETDNHTGGHNCDGTVKEGHGWWVSDEFLEHLPSSPLEISIHDYLDRELDA